MELKRIWIVFFVLTSFCAISQKEVLVFQLSKPESKVTVLLADTVFRVGQPNLFDIRIDGPDVLHKVEVYKGRNTRNPLGFYDVSFDKEGPTFIRVFTRDIKGNVKLAHVEPITVLPLPQVTLLLGGVKRDSAIDKKHLVKTMELTARMNDESLFDYHPVVTSFTLILRNDTININGGKIPFELKHKLLNLDSGTLIEVVDAKVMLPNANQNIKEIPYFSVFLVETDQYSVGERKYINLSE